MPEAPPRAQGFPSGPAEHPYGRCGVWHASVCRLQSCPGFLGPRRPSPVSPRAGPRITHFGHSDNFRDDLL